MAVQITNDVAARFNRAVEIWRRRCAANAATQALTPDLLNAMDEQGLCVAASDVQAMVSALVVMGYTVSAPVSP